MVYIVIRANSIASGMYILIEILVFRHPIEAGEVLYMS
jgi:hypothetical protein